MISTTIDLTNWSHLARAITWVENNMPKGDELLKSLSFSNKVPVIGITGPPGAGKSTLVNALIEAYLTENKKIGILAVDPTSPFHFGSLLGDRVRMAEHFNNVNVYIRSVATRGSLGGLSAQIYQMLDVMKHSNFDLILVETVGVGQSEVEIAGIADVTVLVLVPEAGDDVQTLKSGVMEIADLFVVNKADREGADNFVRNIKALSNLSDTGEKIDVIKTIASQKEGIGKMIEALKSLITKHLKEDDSSRKKQFMFQKAWKLVEQQKMAKIDVENFKDDLLKNSKTEGFNLYQYIKNYV